MPPIHCHLYKLCRLYIALLGVGAAVGVGVAVVVAVAVDNLTKHMGLDVWLAEKTSIYIYLHIHILINTFYLAIDRIYNVFLTHSVLQVTAIISSAA